MSLSNDRLTGSLVHGESWS